MRLIAFLKAMEFTHANAHGWRSSGDRGRRGSRPGTATWRPAAGAGRGQGPDASRRRYRHRRRSAQASLGLSRRRNQARSATHATPEEEADTAGWPWRASTRCAMPKIDRTRYETVRSRDRLNGLDRARARHGPVAIAAQTTSRRSDAGGVVRLRAAVARRGLLTCRSAIARAVTAARRAVRRPMRARSDSERRRSTH
jgi:hypothetical protein